MSSRTNLQALLEETLGSRNVYYQPPESVRMSYPAIVYSREQIRNRQADDLQYFSDTAYSVIVIDKNPDSDIVTRISQLPKCRFSNHYVADNLNHDVFILFYNNKEKET